jgi:cytochrome c biogenesis protein CcdA
MSDINNELKLIDFQDAYNIPPQFRGDTPFVFIGDYYLHDEGVLINVVSEIIDDYSDEVVPLWPAWNVSVTMHIAFFSNQTHSNVTRIINTIQLLNDSWNENVRLLIVHNYSLENPTNGLLFQEYFKEFNLSKHTSYNDSSQLFAGVYIGDDFFLNSDITFEALNDTIKKNLGQNVPLKDITIPLPGGKICLLFFYSPTCGDCHQARKILEKMKGRYPDLDVREYSIADTDNRILQESYFEYYEVPTSKQGTLGVFIGEKYFVDPDKLDDEIEDVIKAKLDGCPCPEVKADKGVVVDKFTGFTVLTVMAAGLVDGVNPCAFATLIFFIMYLSKTGRTKKQVLGIGIAYTLGIFFTYLALGLGLYALIAKSSSEIEIVSKLLFPIMGVIAFILGFYSLYDYFKARKGKKEDMKLQLPKSIKKLIGRTIKQQVQLKYFALIAIITGVLIALFEFLCTGQVYLPTIMVIVAEVPEYQAIGVLYLVLYNLMFVLPLIIIFGLVYFGMSSEQLQCVLDRRRAIIKLLFAAVFFGLGIFLLGYSWVFIF